MPDARPYLLGLDIGSDSIGWAAIALDANTPAGLIRTGVRIFQAGVEGDFESGRAESRAAPRREARLRRRLGDRRRRRQIKLFRLLQRHGLLPEGGRREVLEALDRELVAKYVHAPFEPCTPERRQRAHVLPYFLRARALDQKLEPHELGRALYHLAQRRGFKSNRKRAERKGENLGKVKEEIEGLRKAMAEAGARTLGEHLASLDPEQTRIRQRWTARDMYEEEFEAVWSAQAAHHPDVLTDDLKRRAHKAIFFQRPLKSAKGLVGPCEFERGKRRASWSLPLAQRFRLLQQVGNTRVIEPDGRSRFLTPDERDTLIAALNDAESLTFTKAKKLMGLSNRAKFGFEEGGEKRFNGNATRARLLAVFGERWDAFSSDEREQILQDLRSIQKRDVLVRRGRDVWGLDPADADAFADTNLPDDYCGLSRRALEKIVPLLQDGVPYATAVKEVYGEFHAHPEPLDQLPPVDRFMGHLRNPAVHRALTELRKVINALVRAYGKPERIHIELARDMRQSKKHRQQTAQRNRANQKRREDAAKRIVAEFGDDPKGGDILKVLLADECNWECPYTGNTISMDTLLGNNPQFDIEHIIPFSRSLDNRYPNLTLCHHEFNRHVKRNLTPREAMAHDEPAWDLVLARVKRFKGDMAKAKLARFLMTADEVNEMLADFSARQLTDTRFTTRQAMQYLAMLYGGLFDAAGRRRVQATSGGATKFLRDEWYLNEILGDGGTKTRNDHRHHAVDAVAVALTSAGTIKALADAAERAPEEGKRRFAAVPYPWDRFPDTVRESIDAIIVSHRPNRRLSGGFHEETFYSPPRKAKGGKTVVHVHKPLESLSANQVEAIVDPTIRRMVQDKLDEKGGTPAQVFKNGANLPVIIGRNHRRIPIKAVRIAVQQKTEKLGNGDAARHVKPGANHHVEILEVTGKNGKVKWTGRMVSSLQAQRRHARKEPVISKKAAKNAKYFSSLHAGDTIQIEDTSKAPGGAYLVRAISQQASGGIRFECIELKDARLKADIKKAHQWFSFSPDSLRQCGCRKIEVTPLGDVRRAR